MSLLDEKLESYFHAVDNIVKVHLSDLFAQVNFLIIVQIVTKAIYQLPFERFGTIITIDEKTETIHWQCIDLCAGGATLYTDSCSRMKISDQPIVPNTPLIRHVERPPVKFVRRSARPFSRRPNGIVNVDKQNVLAFMQKGKQYTIGEIAKALNIPKTAVGCAVAALVSEVSVIRTGTETWELPTKELREKVNNGQLWYYMTDDARCAYINGLSKAVLSCPATLTTLGGPAPAALQLFVFKHYKQCAKFICNWEHSSLKKAFCYRIIKLGETGEESTDFYESLLPQFIDKPMTSQREGKFWRALITHYLSVCPDCFALCKQIEDDFGVSRGFVNRMMSQYKPDCIVEINKVPKIYKLIESK